MTRRVGKEIRQRYQHLVNRWAGVRPLWFRNRRESLLEQGHEGAPKADAKLTTS
jgi:hypothetical protein